MNKQELNEISKTERHRFNFEETSNDYRGTLRQSNVVYTSIGNKIWATKQFSN